MTPPYDAAARPKRRGVPLSCAECRRLKLKCSRVFPCSNCEKKGCGQICPNDSLTTGKGNRFVLANTEVLHEKIAQLATRVRHLEDALAESHRMHSTLTHPLLTEELRQIKRPLEREAMDPHQLKEEKTESGDAIESMGSLRISHGGRSTFFGQAASAWYLLQNEEAYEAEEGIPRQNSSLSLEVQRSSASFPFSFAVNNTDRDIRESIVRSLPSASAAQSICSIYFRHAAWMYTPIPQQDFLDTIFRPIYERSAAYQESTGSHLLAVLLMALAFGTLLDLDKSHKSPEAMQYFELARAALGLDSVIEEQSIPGIQALIMMCHFMFLSDISGPRWVIMGMIVKLAQSLGLHRDSNKWKVEPAEAQKRRELFYELLTYDSWQSLTFGRPPSLSLLHIDAKLPHDTVTTASGEVEMSFAAWKHRFTSQCLNIVHDQAFCARTPSYKVIQDLDKKVRLFTIPPSLLPPGFGGPGAGPELEDVPVELTMQRYTAFAIKEMTLFYMHRGYFAQAMEDNPSDPMATKYASSVLAVYTSACAFVGLIESLFKQHPVLTERMWFLFTHVFSCAIVLGTISVKPGMRLSQSALVSLKAAKTLFSRVTDRTRTAKILPILESLTEDGDAAEANTRVHGMTNGHSYFERTVKKEPNELSPLNGVTRLVPQKSPSSPSYSSASPSSQPASPVHNGPRFADAATATNVVQWQYHSEMQPQQTFPESSYRTFPAPMIVPTYGTPNVPLEALHDIFGYPMNGYNMQSLTPPEDTPSPHHPHYHPADSWQNFFSNYNTLN